MKRWICNLLSSAVGLIAAFVTVYFSLRYLREPQGLFDWFVLLASGLIAGIIGFFITWGHFQSDPTPS